MGLSAKNAILVIEFAKEDFDRGKSLIDSALHAVRQRLRPVLVTSLALRFGVLPLAISGGAGSIGQKAIGNTPALQVSQWMCGSGWNEGWSHTSVDLRLWVLAVVFGVFPVCRFALVPWRRKRTRSGLRPTCGYDLRATPRQCPECGFSAVERTTFCGGQRDARPTPNLQSISDATRARPQQRLVMQRPVTAWRERRPNKSARRWPRR